MNTARLKNIVIIILALVNVFLLSLLLSRQLTERNAYARSVEQLTQLYADSGIGLDSNVLPALSSLHSYDPARSTDAELRFASAVLGTVSSIDSGGGIYRYYNVDGICLMRSSGAVEVTAQRAVDDPIVFCREICSAFGYEQYQVNTVGDTCTITAMRELSGSNIYNCTLTFSFSGTTLTDVSGYFLPEVGESSGEVTLDAVTALVRFLDYRNTTGVVCTEIVGIRSGYLLQSSASSPLHLSPVFLISTDVAGYYVNTLTGEILRS